MRDNGVGLNGNNGITSTGFGLRGLHERATQLEGTLCVETLSGGGTQLVLTLPLPLPEDDVTTRPANG